MRKLLALLLLLLAAPFVLFFLLMANFRVNVQTAQPIHAAPQEGSPPAGWEVPRPPGYPVSPRVAFSGPPATVVWAKLLLFMFLGALLLVPVVVIGTLLWRSAGKPPGAGAEMTGGLEALLRNLERMDARIGNLETILIERRR